MLRHARYCGVMIVHACAPTRLLDIGSWSDTAFAEHGAVLNCAMSVHAWVSVHSRARKGFSLTVKDTSLTHGNTAAARPADPISFEYCVPSRTSLRLTALM